LKACKEIHRLLEKIYCETGFDLREYKDSTLTRRIARRLFARGAETYDHYARILDKDPDEYARLFNDLTINVTRFFRDPVPFKALEQMVIPALTHGLSKNIRVWSAGCASGQEPYSIGILLMKMIGPEIHSRDMRRFNKAVKLAVRPQD
jgi:two-component system CheB/CheR fusion protein